MSHEVSNKMLYIERSALLCRAFFHFQPLNKARLGIYSFVEVHLFLWTKITSAYFKLDEKMT